MASGAGDSRSKSKHVPACAHSEYESMLLQSRSLEKKLKKRYNEAGDQNEYDMSTARRLVASSIATHVAFTGMLQCERQTAIREQKAQDITSTTMLLNSTMQHLDEQAATIESVLPVATLA
eukprot:CAMPEP_0198300878 /NCGR_PEP_ID=MMETSP1449-20131203/49819_1 /TAXON_ID=420275 /ORGANISM="Attheya septentrionalis, Strain CCMP2084" /LENGTH=120 /DNA_ID=CAMNT_0044002827 /DNA_START=42 /DNA_END=400 /DNA_ORIENTATION=+